MLNKAEARLLTVIVENQIAILNALALMTPNGNPEAARSLFELAKIAAREIDLFDTRAID